MKKEFFIITNLLINLCIIIALEKYVDLDLIKTASPPRLLDKGILITLPAEINDGAALRTNLDNWIKDYYFTNSSYGIKYIIIPYNLNSKELRYTICINGNWEKDPNNPNFITDKYGKSISYITIPQEAVYYQSYPIIEKTSEKIKKVSFRYFNDSAKNVSLVSSIDNLSLFTNILTKNPQGFWEIELYFSKGEYFYYFFVDGEKILDSENNQKQFHPQYGYLSYFKIQ